MRNPEDASADESLAGSLLLAHPVLRDQTFRRTAILMSSHDTEGAMGVVLNRPLRKTLGQLGGDFAYGPLAQVPVFDGGPVQKRQIILCAWRPHVEPDEEGVQVLFGLDRERASELVAQEGVELRAFLGYAGWTGGQLEGELQRDTWVVAELEPDMISRTPDEKMWRDLLGRLDPQWRLLAGEPDDPGVN
ncbi:MAG: YqgE/AlgH family protein [Burkholderiales bacterium]|nr:YqgE/AlgH family protein [Opitutaceae bacterium]